MSRLAARFRRWSYRYFGGTLLVLSLVLGPLWVLNLRAELAGPAANDRQITLMVLSLLGREHLVKRQLDDELSKRCLKTFLENLDPMKVYFTQADVDHFKQWETKLDDLARELSGDRDARFLKFAYEVFNTFLVRVDERVKLVDELLQQNHDFTVDEELVVDPKLLNYAKDDAEVRDRWRKRIKYDLLVLKADALQAAKPVASTDPQQKLEPNPTFQDPKGLSPKVTKKEGPTGQTLEPSPATAAAKEDPKEKLTRRYHSFAKRMRQIKDDDLLEMFLTAFTTGYDPHTTYMSPSTLENFDIVMRLKLEGIGAALKFDDGFTVVTNLIPGGAAEKDGRLKPQDRVVGVGQGDGGEIVDVIDMNLSDVVQLIRGKRGTIVRLKVVPVGQVEPKVYDITRASIELRDSEARSQLFEEGTKSNGQPYKVGVIDLPSFYMDMNAARMGVADFKSTTRDVRRILDEFRSKNVDAVVLDLRRNGGGSLTEAISLTGLFIDQGPIVQVKDSDGRVQHYDDLEAGAAWNGPLVVLTSKFSASASEIFAGAIQDYRRGVIVGDYSTHGKGTVQSLLDLGRQIFDKIPNAPSLGALKITMQQFYRPSGDSTQRRGVLADIELPSLTTHLDDIAESDLDFAVEFDKVDAVPHPTLNLVDRTVLTELKSKSHERCESSKDFQKVLTNIERYKKQKARKAVSLNEEKFLADRAELNADKEEEKELEELNNPHRPVVKRDYYFNEALAITLDYLRLIKVASTN